MSAIPNTANFGVARGNISNIKKFENADGSKKYMVTVATPNAYVNSNGEVGCQYVRTEGKVSKNASNDGVYEYLEVGDFVQVNYIALPDDYQDRNGKWHYGMVLRIQGVDILESKAAKAARKQRTANHAAAAPAQNNSAFAEDNGEEPIFN